MDIPNSAPVTVFPGEIHRAADKGMCAKKLRIGEGNKT